MYSEKKVVKSFSKFQAIFTISLHQFQYCLSPQDLLLVSQIQPIFIFKKPLCKDNSLRKYSIQVHTFPLECFSIYVVQVMYSNQ